MIKKTLVLGASKNANRYSNLAIHKLVDNNIETVAVGKEEGYVNEVKIYSNVKNFESIHTITLYLNKIHQLSYYQYIIDLKPKRVIFNPGTENIELEKLLTKHNIKFEKACTLVLLSIGEF